MLHATDYEVVQVRGVLVSMWVRSNARCDSAVDVSSWPCSSTVPFVEVFLGEL